MLYSSQRDSTLGDMCSWQLVFISDSRNIQKNPQDSTISRLNWFKQLINLLNAAYNSEEIVILWNVIACCIILKFLILLNICNRSRLRIYAVYGE